MERRALIEVRDLHKAFGAEEVLRGVTLQVLEGDTCVLLGASGSGKTVLMKHLLGLLQPDRGQVLLEGRDLATLSERALAEVRADVGMLFQSGALFDSITVEDNVAFPLRERASLPEEEVRGRVREALALVGLADLGQAFPAALSGGMRKRVAFARAIVSRPKILLYDEPTAGLDPITTHYVQDAILAARAQGGATSLIITHDLTSAFRLADQVALLAEGRIIECLPPDAFRASRHPEVRAFLHRWLERDAQAPA